MFSGFYFALRDEGLKVSLSEWLMLIDALSRDLADNSLREFYGLARSLLVKNEALYDLYDAAFIKYFGEASPQTAAAEQKRERAYDPDFFNPARYGNPKKTGQRQDQDLSALGASLEAQGRPARQMGDGIEEHDEEDGGSAFGKEAFSLSGLPGTDGVSFGDRDGGMTAVKIAGERRYRDYQDKQISNTRQYEIALRSLRQLSSKNEGQKDELNLDATIEETGRNNGHLSLVWERPRKNAIKVIVLMDSIGSIYHYHSVCKKLFNAAHRSIHFKEIKFFYFHNCIYGRLYKDQWLDQKETILTEEFLRLHNADHRMLIVGDGRMSEAELWKVGGVLDWGAEYNTVPGIDWLRRLARHFPYAAWLNPVPAPLWGTEPGYGTIKQVGEIFPMFELTPGGLAKAVKKLLVR